MIKYEAMNGMYRSTIVKHEIERESDSFVWIKNGRRQAVKSQYSQFFNTWNEAHNFLIVEARTAYDKIKNKLDVAADELNKTIELVNPELEN